MHKIESRETFLPNIKFLDEIDEKYIKSKIVILKNPNSTAMAMLTRSPEYIEASKNSVFSARAWMFTIFGNMDDYYGSDTDSLELIPFLKNLLVRGNTMYIFDTMEEFTTWYLLKNQ